MPNSYQLSKKKRKNETGGAIAPPAPGGSVGADVGSLSKARRKARDTAGRTGVRIDNGITPLPVDDNQPTMSRSASRSAGKPIDKIQKPSPYDILRSPYKTQGDLDARAAAIVEGQFKPQFDSLAAQERQEQATHAARAQDIIAYGNWLADRLGGIQTSGQAASQQLQNNLQATNTATAAGLAGATGAAQQAQQAEAARLNAGPTGAPVDSQSQQLLNAALSASQAGMNNINTTLGGLLAGLAEGATQGTTYVGQSRLDEEARNLEALNEINMSRKDLAGQKSAAIPEALMNLEGLELQRTQTAQQVKESNREFNLAKQQFGQQKANQLFQQWLAEQELGLKTSDQSFQQWLAKQGLQLQKGQLELDRSKYKTDKNIQWAQIGISRAQVETDRAKLAQDVKNAKSAEQKERAKLRADSYNTALGILNGYMAPNENARNPQFDQDPDLPGVQVDDKTYDAQQRPRYDTAVTLMRQGGADDSIIYQILSNSADPRWAARARKDLKSTRLKRKAKRRGLPPAGSGPTLRKPKMRQPSDLVRPR